MSLEQSVVLHIIWDRGYIDIHPRLSITGTAGSHVVNEPGIVAKLLNAD